MSLSLLATFEDLISCTKVLTSADCESEFLHFALNQEECRKKWQAAALESQILQAELEMTNKYVAVLEAKLSHAQRMIDKEKQKRREREIHISKLEKNINHAGDLLVAELGKEAYQNYPFLYVTCNSSGACGDNVRPGDGGGSSYSTISEAANSSDSLFSNLSYTRCEDDLDLTMTHCGKIWKKHRPSLPAAGNEDSAKKQHPFDTKQINTVHKPADKCDLAGTGMITMKMAGKNGTYQPMKNHSKEGSSSSQGLLHPSTIPLTTVSSVLDINALGDTKPNPLTSQTKGSPVGSSYPLGLKTLNNRSHAFCTKTVIFLENCDHCGKRIKFGKLVMKCHDCRASCHPECREHVPLPCVPVNITSLAHQRGVMGTISDYAPPTAPMAPSLIVHCINEVDLRGLNEVGIYRISGAEKDVRELKERFLRGKGVPNLSKLDIHLVCGTIKHFLRSLSEPLVTNLLWQDFVKAAENLDADDSRALLYQAISELPQPNRDTLAFLIMHLQRVADSPECKMPLSNLAKVFGPTIVGNSNLNCKPTLMFKETEKQVSVVQSLINIPCDYWANFLKVDTQLISGFPSSATTVCLLPDCTRTLKNNFTPDYRFTIDAGEYFATPLQE